MALKLTGTLRIYAGGTAIAKAKNAELTLTKATNDVTTKDSDGWIERLPALKTASFSTDGLVVDGDEAVLWSAYDGSTDVAIMFTSNVSTESKYSFNAIITNFSMSSPETAQVATWNISGESNGAVVKAAVA